MYQMISNNDSAIDSEIDFPILINKKIANIS